MAPAPPTCFITGTDTGVGKTVLTALVLDHLLRQGRPAVAFKPFATGSRADARLLAAVARAVGPHISAAPEAWTATRLSPFFYRRPLAPWVAAQREGRRITRAQALRAIRRWQQPDRWLWIEGCGGLLTPLGPGYSARELILELGCPAVIVAVNRLGVINQVRLAWEALGGTHGPTAAVVLMNRPRPDASAASNPRALAVWVAPTPIFVCPHRAGPPSYPGTWQRLARAWSAQLTALVRAVETFRPAPPPTGLRRGRGGRSSARGTGRGR